MPKKKLDGLEKLKTEVNFYADGSNTNHGVIHPRYRSQKEIYEEMIEMACNLSMCSPDELDPLIHPMFKIISYQLSLTKQLKG